MDRQLHIDTCFAGQDKDSIPLTLNFFTLLDGTNYAAGKVFNVAAKNIMVKIEDDNFQKTTN